MALRKMSRAASLAFRESVVRVRAWTESPVPAEMVRPASGSGRGGAAGVGDRVLVVRALREGDERLVLGIVELDGHDGFFQ